MDERRSPPPRPALFWRLLVALSMGFSSGLPLLTTGSLLQAWMHQTGVALATIGLFALVGLPYTLKFLWAPLFDRFVWRRLGRRRGWLLGIQLLLMVAMGGLGLVHPVEQTALVAVAALFVTLFSASQDVVIDAYRREDLRDEELGLGSSLYVNGYRVGMLLAGSGGLILADHLSFSTLYLLLAATMAVGVITTLLCREPPLVDGQPQTLREAVIAPFSDYLTRPQAVSILLFILCYKLGDTLAASLTTAFYLEVGFSKSEIGTIVKLFGFWATLGGGLIGGLLLLRWGIARALWWFGGLQMLSTLGFALLAKQGTDLEWLAGVVAFENLAAGMGTAAFVAYMGSLTNRRFTATQYALLSSLMGVPRVLVAAPAGYLVEWLGWFDFFILCTVAALPGLWLLQRLMAWGSWHPTPTRIA